MRRILFIVISMVTLIFSCQDNDSIVEPTLSGQLNYLAYDTTGTLIVNGWLIVELKDATTAEGSWNLKNIYNRDDIGPQEGTGKFMALIRGSKVTINLNPNNADHNVYLNGTLIDNGIEGEWVWSSFTGPTNWGTFTAFKN